ncbi:hypothetical protein BBP40_011267 [Aspergillus hancockii]|nr:hypothetical protein BBP40_011267 [Aspergillus hancockii]
MALTVAEASGLIVAEDFVLQLFLPLAFPIILIAFIADENVLGRYLHSLLWPSILSTSTAAVTGVQRRVTVTGWIQTIGLGIILVASICTPIGLYDSIEPAQDTTNVPFGYLQDKSAFGYGTPPRTIAPFTRTCGLEQACPGPSLNRTCHQQGLLESCTVRYESRIPESLLSMFRDGATELRSQSVSSIADMQYQAYINGTDDYSILGWYAKPFYRSLQVLILDEKVEPAEGLVVDMKDGAIGFRNHTEPTHSTRYGSAWKEDILLIEPETQCVPLNLTLDFELPLDREMSITARNVVLTDHGGLSEIIRPGPSLDAPTNGQRGFDLQKRAFKDAWLHNFLTLVYFNATDPDPSDISRLDVVPRQRSKIPENTKFSIGYRNIQSTIEFGQDLDLTRKRGNGTNLTVNPHGVTRQDFDFATTLCGGSTSTSPSTVNSTIIGCGVVFGAATRTDGVSSLLTDPGSPWRTPMYSCASAIRAVVKTVHF